MALATSIEAVDVYRVLTQASSGAYLPDLASSLNNLSVRQSEVGDRQVALATSIEAVTLYRGLVRASPAAHLPDLAISLNSLSGHQAEVGDWQMALATSIEAVDIYRTLVRASPAAYLPDLAMALNNLANHQAKAGDRQAALSGFEAAMEGLGPGSQAELLLARATWRSSDDRDGMTYDICRAAEAATIEPDPATAGRARRHVRQETQALHDGVPTSSRIPEWAYLDIPQRTIDLVDAWLKNSPWTELEAQLRSEYEYLAGPSSALAVVDFLHPGLAGVAQLQHLLSAIAEHGMEPVLTAGRGVDAADTLVSAWLATPDWNTSRAFLREHKERLDEPDVDALLAAGNDLESRRHRAILQLAGPLSISAVYDLVVDLTMAVDAAMAAVETGDVERLSLLLQVSPPLARIPFVAPYLAAVLGVLGAEAEPESDALMRQSAAEGTQRQREAGAVRLRRLADRRPEHRSTLTSLALVLDSHD